MIRFVWVIVWLAISAYAFYLLPRRSGRRERTGMRLVGIAALLVGASIAIPNTPDGLSPGDYLWLAAASLGALMLVAGLAIAIPAHRRERTDGSEAAPDDSEAP